MSVRRVAKPALKYGAIAAARRASRLVPDTLGERLRSGLPAALRVAKPDENTTCKRRNERRHVLFALRHTRKGSNASRRQRNSESYVRC